MQHESSMMRQKMKKSYTWGSLCHIPVEGLFKDTGCHSVLAWSMGVISVYLSIDLLVDQFIYLCTVFVTVNSCSVKIR